MSKVRFHKVIKKTGPRLAASLFLASERKAGVENHFPQQCISSFQSCTVLMCTSYVARLAVTKECLFCYVKLHITSSSLKILFSFCKELTYHCCSSGKSSQVEIESAPSSSHSLYSCIFTSTCGRGGGADAAHLISYGGFYSVNWFSFHLSHC